MQWWTPEEVERLKEMAAERVSARLIGLALGRTKNMIIGAARRRNIKLAPPHSGGMPKGYKYTQPRKKPRRKPMLRLVQADMAEVVAPVSLGLGLMDLTPNSCRWPYGDPKDPTFGFCGAPKVMGSSYCECHRRASVDDSRPIRRSLSRERAVA